MPFAYDPNGNLVGTTGTGTGLNASSINGVTVTGTASSGKVITATSATAATWQTPNNVNGVIVSGTPTTSQVLTATTSTTATWQTIPNSFPSFTNWIFITNQTATWGGAQFFNFTTLNSNGSAFTVNPLAPDLIQVLIDCTALIIAQLQTPLGFTGNFKTLLYKGGSPIAPLIGLPGFTGDTTACGGSWVESFVAPIAMQVSFTGPGGAVSGPTGFNLLVFQIA